MAAGACALVLSCAHRGRESGAAAEPDVRIWVSPVVRWEPGAARELRFAIENASDRTVVLAEPDAALAHVDVYAGPENDRVCGTAPPPGLQAQARAPAIALGPGDRIGVRVDLESACRGVPPGEYRFVVSYRAQPSAPGTKLWAGSLPARYGTVLVERGAAAARTPAVRPQRPARAREAARPKPEERSR
jgi:hypothetical protein